MKKAKPTARRLAAKGRAAHATVDAYLARLPEPARTTLNKVRATIQLVVPAETTETISYGIPTFKYKGSLVWYAAFSKHCSLFPGSSVIEQLKKDLKDYRTSKGTIQFAVDKPIPSALLRRIVKACVAQKARQKKARQKMDIQKKFMPKKAAQKQVARRKTARTKR